MALEIEKKFLLGDVETFRANITALGYTKVGMVINQRNHYFQGSGDIGKVVNALLEKEEAKAFLTTLKKFPKSVSVRTRSNDEDSILVVKGSETDAENGGARAEAELDVNASIEELDEVLLQNGYQVKAKWFRPIREVYMADGVVVTLDFNSGYGWLSEVELLLEQDDLPAEQIAAWQADAEKRVLESGLALGGEPLANDRLQRMYAYYNENWQSYYGTPNTFIVA